MDLRNFSDGTPTFEGGRKKASPVPAIIIMVLLAALGLYMGISGMTKKSMSLDDAFSNGSVYGSRVSGVPSYGASHPNFEYTHKFGFIPLIDEYYYIIMSDDMQHGVLVRADKDFGKNFDSETYKNISGIEIKGNVKSTSKKVQENFSGVDYRSIRSADYIDLLYNKMNIIWLIIGVYNALAVVLLIIHFAKNHGSAPETVVGKCIAGVMIVGALVCTYLLVYMLVQI